ncbi:uncharacterized protein Z519_00899 [Cladophialophora bantiana CBS 173.52]|uniref:Ubiquitin 3 binding protein But2 C-terminal domain-containing protein n=1 Tax=Cladophialophora bantiana (strain ATCC 10958 / CBS 173.52 / CDC B-1940 / NIH 8579) TaxID=1442370 RepID=A0A0D2FAT9_CLAB1|nr:uncharacterized protein Z519_00899 [Cladophialophora bantiana CBS 173.52]KIW99236.1 hypothetical protein Z519_00899 [Cladophialophora bantiana CBS 173.52]
MQLPVSTVAILAFQVLQVSAAALNARLTPLQNDCNLPEGDPLAADCAITDPNTILRPRQDGDVPLGLTSITVGSGTTSSGGAVTISVPYSLSRDPTGPLTGGGTGTFDSSPLKSAVLIPSDVTSSSQGAFSSAQCTFYTGSADLGDGDVSCVGTSVGSASTDDDGTEVVLNAPATCVSCSYS